MSASQQPHPLGQQAAGTMSSNPEPLTITVNNIMAKVFLKVPVEDLIPDLYLTMAKQTATVHRKPWIFRNGNEDGRGVDVRQWSTVDIRYRGVFKNLRKCPKLKEGLWDGGSESCQPVLDRGKLRAQAHVVYALLNDIGLILKLNRETHNGRGVFFLAPRLNNTPLEYWTGYREKYRDGPEPAGSLALKFDPHVIRSQMILPVSMTMKEQSLQEALEDKFKLLMGQLLYHLRPLDVPGDKLPDQEIFLIGVHGSKLHLMRAFFPGQKTSCLWCRRELPRVNLPLALRMDSPPGLVQNTSHGADDDDSETDNATTNEHIENVEEEQASNTRSRRLTPEEIERICQHLEAIRLSRLDNEPDLRTFRILATREYDLWLRKDFMAAVQILSALHFYLLSGHAQCAVLQETFIRHPYFSESDGYESPESNEEIEAQVRRDLRREQREIEEEEEQLRREEIIRREEEAEATRLREAMRNSRLDRITSLWDARGRWWDFVWSDSGESLVQNSGNGNGDEEEEDMIVRNLRS